MTTPAQHRPAAQPWAQDFDVREYARSAAGYLRDKIDLSGFDDNPLSPETLHSLRYLRHIERSMVRYLRRVLVTPAHKDARITAFLTTWAFETFWIADLLSAILERHDVNGAWSATYAQSGTTDLAGPSAASRWHRLRDGLAPIVRSVASNSIGESVVGVHMAAASVDEQMCLVAYQRLDHLADHPRLSQAMGAVTEVKARQHAFFEAQAGTLLARSRLARILTRARLRRSQWPVGGEGRSEAWRRRVLRHLFLDAPEVVEQADRRVRQLPGLERLAILRATVASVT